MCLAEGDVVPATVVDHVVPHRKNVESFWLGKVQSLCMGHHNNTKQHIEQHGYVPDIGPNGWPIDPNHPVNKVSKELTVEKKSGGRGA
jgi:5-methylcytosine-specific restriction endonuclease McrA